MRSKSFGNLWTKFSILKIVPIRCKISIINVILFNNISASLPNNFIISLILFNCLSFGMVKFNNV